MADQKNVLVFSAHAVDFLAGWRGDCKYAEAFQRVYPQVTSELS